MEISELTVDDFLKEKINLSDSNARQYAKESSLAEEKLIGETKKTITEELNKTDYATKKDIKDLEIKLTQLEAKMEKGFKEIIVWIIGAMVAIVGLAVVIIKIF